jgi:hypothetical protein
MSTSRPPDEPIHERFPLLRESDDTPDDVRADLHLTDTELGTRYRRGKQTRLNRYQQLEDALALQAARNYQATTEPILEVLQELMGGTPTLLDGLVPVVPVMKEDQLQRDVRRAVVDLCDRYPDGTVAVIAVESADIRQGLLSVGWWASPKRSECFTFGDVDGRKVDVYKPVMARGLMFDGVVVVEPLDFPENPGKHSWVYTALSRASTEAKWVHRQPHQVEGAGQFGSGNTPPSSPDPGDLPFGSGTQEFFESRRPVSDRPDPPWTGGIPDPARRWAGDPEKWRTSDLSDGAAESRLPTPWTGAESPEVRYILSTIEHGAPVAVGAHRLDAVLTVMSGLDLDPTSVDLFREVICCLKPPSSLSAISERHGTSRQAMSVRRQRLAPRLSKTRGESAIAALEKFVHQRLETVTRWPADDPFLSIALSTLDQKFPNAVDAVRLGLWLASPEGYGDVPVGFVLNDEGELIPR